MVEPPPRDPRDPSDDETVVGPPDEAVVGPADEVVVDETVVEPPADETYVEEEIVEEPPRKGPLIWPWLLALLLLVLGGLGAYWWFTQEDKKDVPAVVGMQENTAVATVEDEGFESDVQRQESTRPKGVVFDQDPDGGTELEEGKTVRLVVSTGPPQGTVPNLVGQKRDDAVSATEAAGFDAKVVEVFSTKTVDTVVDQDPGAGETVQEGAVVELKVSKGGKPVVVPDVVGTSSSQATKTLRDAGFEADLHSVPSEEPAGTVVAQNPGAGQTAKQGTKVRLNVAQAPGETTTTTTTTAPAPAPPPPTTPAPAGQGTVPDAVGQQLADAGRQFADEGIKLDVLYVPSDEPKGRIIAQAKPAGTKVDKGSAVTVSVSRGSNPQPPTAVPDVVGMPSNDARDRLESAGFEVLALDITGENRTGRVESQSPRGGSIPRGSLVLLYVGA